MSKFINIIRIFFALIIGVPVLILWVVHLLFFTIVLKVLNIFAKETISLTTILEDTLEVIYTSEEDEHTQKE